MFGAFSEEPLAMSPVDHDGPVAAYESTRTNSRHGALKLKRSTMDLPPESSISNDIFPRPKPERSNTVQSFLCASPKADPYPARFYDEPELVLYDHDTILKQIHSLIKADLPRVPKWPQSRSSSGYDTPSRTSSIDPTHDAVFALGGLTLDPLDIHDVYTPILEGENGQFPGAITAAPARGTTRPSASKPGAAGESAQTRSTSQRMRGAASSNQAAVDLGRVQTGRVGKPAATGSVGNQKPEEEEEEASHMRLGCPMVKANPDRYVSVIGPCTDLRGLAPKPKALMEHLKKQHSRSYRCKTCWRWFRNEVELNEHQNYKDLQCTHCCKSFKKKKDYDQHVRENTCEVSERSRPEIFTPQQETAFENMKNQSSRHRGLKKKYRWCFENLFPDRADEAETLWIYYNFTVFNHKLPVPLTNEQFPEVAGGLRTAASPPASPSEDDLTSPPLSGHVHSSPEGVPSSMGPPPPPPARQREPIIRPPYVPHINTNTSSATAVLPSNSSSNPFFQPIAPGMQQGQSGFAYPSTSYAPAPNYGMTYPSSSTGPSYAGLNWPPHEPSVYSNPGATETSSTTQGHMGPNTPIFQMPVAPMESMLGSHEDPTAQGSFNLQEYERMYTQWDDDFSTGQWLPKQNLPGPAQGNVPLPHVQGEPEVDEEHQDSY